MKTTMVTKVVWSLVLVGTFAASTFAQSTTNPPPGPTLEETTNWLVHEGPPLMGSYRSETTNGMSLSLSREVTAINVSQCVLAISEDAVIKSGGVDLPTTVKTITSTATLPLKDIDLATATVQPSSLGAKTSDPIFEISFKTRGETVSVDMSDGKHFQQSAYMLTSRNTFEGERILAALKRAAVLCGSTASVF